MTDTASLDLFTSRRARDSIEPHASTLRASVLAYIRFEREHGATDDQIQYVLNMNPNTQ